MSILAFRGNELLVHCEEAAARLPSTRAMGCARAVRKRRSHPRWGCSGGEAASPCELPAEIEPPAGMAFHGLRRLWGTIDEEAWKIAGRAVQIVDWDRNHRFCGRCGTPPTRSRGALAHLPALPPATLPPPLPRRHRPRRPAATRCSSPAPPTSRPASTAPSPASSSPANRWRKPWRARSGGDRRHPRRHPLLRQPALAVPEFPDGRLHRPMGRAATCTRNPERSRTPAGCRPTATACPSSRRP